MNALVAVTLLSEALFTTTQRKVLGLLYSHPSRSYYTNEILRATGMGVATIKRELDRMVAAGILSRNRQGNQLHYQANPNCPIHQELLSIVRKTLGVVDVLRQVLEPLVEHIECVFVFGSLADGKESVRSDVDLMLIGDIGFTEAVAALYPAQQSLSREINPRVYRRDEWSQLLQSSDAFVRDVLSRPRLDIIGNRNELEESGWD